jgi:bifunctional DNA-binding transcriptional regulator/antitoxin component of YhaV-PrlF toxin-antitoxin module
MKTTMDATGRVLIPSEIRRRASLSGPTQLEASWEDGRIVIEPRPLAVKLVQRGRFLVGEPTGNTPRMPAAALDATIDELRTTPRR